MSFLSGLGRSLLAAGTGFLTGGPVGAGIGLVSGALSGDSAHRTTNTSNTTTRQTQLRAWTEDEQNTVNQAMQGLGVNLEGMTPEALEQVRNQVYEGLYGLASGEIKDTFNTREAQDYSASASRGAANTSAGDVRSDRRDALEGRELGRASTQAGLAAQEAGLREQENQRAAIRSYLETLNSMWNQRLQGSTVVQTGTGQAVAPDTFLPSISAGLGYALGDQDSHLNSDLLGGL